MHRIRVRGSNSTIQQLNAARDRAQPNAGNRKIVSVSGFHRPTSDHRSLISAPRSLVSGLSLLVPGFLVTDYFLLITARSSLDAGHRLWHSTAHGKPRQTWPRKEKTKETSPENNPSSTQARNPSSHHASIHSTHPRESVAFYSSKRQTPLRPASTKRDSVFIAAGLCRRSFFGTRALLCLPEPIRLCPQRGPRHNIRPNYTRRPHRQ